MKVITLIQKKSTIRQVALSPTDFFAPNRKKIMTILEHGDIDRRRLGLTCRRDRPALYLISNMARKASWGISTLPTRRIRFLPSFCFSRTFIFRV